MYWVKDFELDSQRVLLEQLCDDYKFAIDELRDYAKQDPASRLIEELSELYKPKTDREIGQLAFFIGGIVAFEAFETSSLAMSIRGAVMTQSIKNLFVKEKDICLGQLKTKTFALATKKYPEIKDHIDYAARYIEDTAFEQGLLLPQSPTRHVTVGAHSVLIAIDAAHELHIEKQIATQVPVYKQGIDWDSEAVRSQLGLQG